MHKSDVNTGTRRRTNETKIHYKFIIRYIPNCYNANYSKDVDVSNGWLQNCA